MNFISREENQKCKVIQTNIEAVKKEANKEMEQNEELENFKMRLTDDLNYSNKQRKCFCVFNSLILFTHSFK